MLRFASPEYLYALILIPIIVLLWILYRRRQRRLLQLFGDAQLVTPLMRGYAPSRLLVKFILLLTAIALLIVALARPQTGSKLREIQKEGGQIMLAVDVSRSMLAEDFKPNRLERTKYAISRLVEKLDKEQVGMVVFAGDAYIQLPITADYVSAASFVRTLSPDMISRQGTSVQKAIEMAITAMPQSDQDVENSQAIILITDGESHDDDPMAAAKIAAEKGIAIHTIGIGTPEGAPISINGEMVKDEEGQIVVSKLDEETLSQIAAQTDGVYVRSTESSLGLDEIYRHIERMQSKSFETVVFEEYAEQFFYLLYVVLLLLIVEFALPNHKHLRKED